MSIRAMEVRGVHVRYRGAPRPSLENVTLGVEHGERLALLGLNGSGKTTLLMAAVGLVPFSGELMVDGVPVQQRTLAQVRRRVGVLFPVPDDQVLLPRVLEDVAFTLERRGVDRAEARDRAGGMLERLGIADLAERAPHQLSRGQLVRVALAGALLGDPRLMLLDEPTASLDARGRHQLATLLQSLEPAMVMATHDIPFARAVCSHFAILEEGRLVQGPAPIAELPGDPFGASL